jgi:hypothetical protein
MQAPSEPASHESEPNESHFCKRLIELCFWHVNDVVSSSSGYRFAIPWIDPPLCLARTLPFPTAPERLCIRPRRVCWIDDSGCRRISDIQRRKAITATSIPEHKHRISDDSPV